MTAPEVEAAGAGGQHADAGHNMKNETAEAGSSSSEPPLRQFGPYTEHPVAALFPLMRDGDEKGYADLVHSIRVDGQLEPIVMDGNRILDGRNRYLACVEAGVQPNLVQYADLGLSMPAHEFAYEKNNTRRHLTNDQRTAIAASFMRFDAEEWKRQKAQAGREGGKLGGRGNKKTLPPNSGEGFVSHKRPTHTLEKVAAAAKVSRHKAQQGINVVQRGSPELQQAVREGKVTLAKAQRQLTPQPVAVVTNEGARAGLEDLVAQGQPSPPAKPRKRPSTKQTVTARRVLEALWMFAEFCKKIDPDDAADACDVDAVDHHRLAITRWLDDFYRAARGEEPRTAEIEPPPSRPIAQRVVDGDELRAFVSLCHGTNSSALAAVLVADSGGDVSALRGTIDSLGAWLDTLDAALAQAQSSSPGRLLQ